MIKTLRGKTPVIHPDAFVSEFAYVVGDVTIGARSSVWPGVVIRGESPIVIGEGTCVQDNSTIHSDANGARIGDKFFLVRDVQVRDNRRQTHIFKDSLFRTIMDQAHEGDSHPLRR